MGTPQVYPLVWNKQGQTPDNKNTPTVWDPKAPAPQPLPVNTTDKQENDIVRDQANPGKTPLETEIAKIQAHNDVAANTLCQKNRKRKQSSMELPFDPTIEEGTTWQLQGFAKNFDGKWLITEVVYTFVAKSGSRLSIELMQVLDPPQKTPGSSQSLGKLPSNGSKPITVPQQPTDKAQLLNDASLNGLTPKPANVADLTLSGNETSPTWLNQGGQLNPDQQDLSLGNVGPAG